MFEQPEPSDVRRGPAFWLSVALCVVALLFMINLFRANQPRHLSESPTAFVPEHFEGTIAKERSSIAAGEILPFRVNFNHRALVKGRFDVVRGSPWITFLMLDAKNYESWLSGAKYVAAVSTGKVPSGKVTRHLEAGVYYLIFDNRISEKDAIVDVDLVAE